MNIMSIISVVCLVLLIVGFLLGFFRSFKRALSRFLIMAATLLISIFVAPVLSGMLIKNYVSGYVFSGFGMTIDFKELLEGMTSVEGAVTDILSAQATETLVANLMNLVLNIAAFLVIFLGLMIVTLIIYWISLIIIKVATRKNSDYEIKKENNRRISFRLTGGLFGFLTSLIFCFVLAVPVFGVMNICDQFLKQDTSDTASAHYSSSLVAGQLFYTENQTIGEVEGLIKQYSEIKNTIDSSAIGKICNTLGVAKLSASTFEYLTTAEQNGVKVSLTNEVVSVIKVYNAYKEGFVENTVDTQDIASMNKAICAVEKIYSQANHSAIVQSYIVEMIPKFRERWLAGKAYLGIEFPVQGEYRDLVLMIVDKGFDTTNINEINNNIYSLLGVAKIANNAGVIKALNENAQIVELLADDETDLIKDVLVELSNSKFKDVLPNLIKEVVKEAYNLLINTDGILTKDEISNIFADVDGALPETIDWEIEGECLQNLICSAFDVFDVFYESGSESDVIINNIDKLGIVIDNARKSVFSNHFKLLVVEMIDNKIDVSILGEDAMNILIAKLKSNWSSADFKFEAMFNTLKQTALLAKKITVDLADLTAGGLDKIMNSLETVVGDILANEQVKNTFVSILEKDVIEKFIPAEHSETIDVVKDMVNSFMSETNVETLKNDIAAGKEIIDIVTKSTSGVGFSLEEEGLTKQEKAAEIVQTITNSNAIMTVVEAAVSETVQTNKLEEMVQNLQGEDVEILKQSILALDTTSEDAGEQAKNEENKAALIKLFGLGA